MKVPSRRKEGGGGEHKIQIIQTQNKPKVYIYITTHIFYGIFFWDPFRIQTTNREIKGESGENHKKVLLSFSFSFLFFAGWGGSGKTFFSGAFTEYHGFSLNVFVLESVYSLSRHAKGFRGI